MADDQLRILLTSKIDSSQKSITDLNNQINQLATKLNKLDLKISIDEKFTSTLNNFINTFNQSTQKTNDALSNQVKIVNDETKAINNATEAQKKWNAEKEKTVRDATGKPLSVNTTYGNNLNNSKQVVDSLPDGSIRKITDTSNMKKDLSDYSKMLDEAYKMNADFNMKMEALDKQHYLAMQQNQKREADFVKQKADTISKIADMNRRFGSDANVKGQLDDLQIKASSIKSVGDYKQAIGGIQSELKLIGSSAQTSGSHVLGFNEQLKVAMTRMPIWLLAGTAIFGTKRVIEDMIGTIVMLDTQMTQLKRVMDSDTNFPQMLKGSIEIANELGQKVTDINKALIEAAQAGFKANDALDITKTAVIASNVSNMTPEESMSNMIAAMKAFNITAQDSIQIVDKLNQVDNDYSITTQNLAQSVTHAGAAAKTYGVSLDQLIGYTTAIGEVTRESGNIIGNMEKSVFSRIFSAASVATLKEINIEVSDMNGENRKASDILTDLGTKWNSLSSTQQQNTGVTIAGRNQLTR